MARRIAKSHVDLAVGFDFPHSRHVRERVSVYDRAFTRRINALLYNYIVRYMTSSYDIRTERRRRPAV